MRTTLQVLIAALISFQAFGYGTGYVTYPLHTKQKIISAELLGTLNTGKGVGIQGRYTHKFLRNLVGDAGVGISSGDRSSRIFAGLDYEIFPDYMKQPRVSVKTSVEHAKEFEIGRTILSVSPTLSKGFNFWGKEAFPYLAIPVALSLDTDVKKYESTVAASLGMSSRIPLESYKNLIGSIEGTINIKDSYSGVMFGISYPLE